jgi:hypothetical protein
MLLKSVNVPEDIFGIFEIYRKVVFSNRNNSCRIMPSYFCKTIVWVM